MMGARAPGMIRYISELLSHWQKLSLEDLPRESVYIFS